MPFTLAHSAAALPFRRSHLIFSAVVIGTLAPDFEYFLRLAPSGRFGHTLWGCIVFTLPVAFIVLWLFHELVKRPAIALCPRAIQTRLPRRARRFEFWGFTRTALILLSLLVGIVTHLLWDSFTHPNTWLYNRWPFLGKSFRLPLIGHSVPIYKLLQHGSTLLGISILSICFVRWYQTIPVFPSTENKDPLTGRKISTILALLGVAAAGGAIRSLAGQDLFVFKKSVGEFVVTAIALAWWELVFLGIVFRRRSPQNPDQVG